MINRNNYQFAQHYLDYLSEVTQLDPHSVDRYWFYLKHLLLWADEVSLSQMPVLRPAFRRRPRDDPVRRRRCEPRHAEGEHHGNARGAAGVQLAAGVRSGARLRLAPPALGPRPTLPLPPSAAKSRPKL